MTTAIAPVGRKCSTLPESYLELCSQYLPRPIHTRGELQSATRMVEALAGHKLNPDQEDYLDALSTFIEQFERTTRRPRATHRGVVLVKFLLEQHGLNPADLSRLIEGSRGLGAMILRGERSLTVSHIRKISQYFGVSASLLIGD